ncbi:MAG: TrmH family RNA methyltransferase [Treponema sp.]|jgi:TrmH family RNA methyltransferase|nr:TrmH family RNA methyltransferase [Treponema sp.]
MIPLIKLSRLPRHQRLRKAEKILAGTELEILRAPGAGPLTADRLAYLGELLDLLAGDGEFPPPQRQALGEAARNWPGSPEARRRIVNTARHLLLAAMGRSSADWDFVDAAGRLDGAGRRIFPGMEVYLEDIRSPFNVGAMFRVCESFGVERLRLSPLCADPRHPRALRTSMGCVDILPWERRDLNDAPAAGSAPGPDIGPCFALETGGTDLGDFVFPRTGTLIAGSEELGVSPESLARADASLGRLSIRTYGAKGSLNVSVAFGIAVQRWAEALAGTP